jgi:hypothetical protein
MGLNNALQGSSESLYGSKEYQKEFEHIFEPPGVQLLYP